MVLQAANLIRDELPEDPPMPSVDAHNGAVKIARPIGRARRNGAIDRERPARVEGDWLRQQRCFPEYSAGAQRIIVSH